jgi:hypothetical protein
VKVFQFLSRVAFSLLIAFIVSFSSAVIFFNYSGHKTVDRAFLVLVPTLAIAYLLFEIFPTLWKWLGQKQLTVLITFGVLAMIGAMAVLLPLAVSTVYYLGIAAFAIILFALMLPAVSFVERFRESHSIWHYSFGFLLSLFFAYAAVGFLSDVIKTTFNMIVFTAILIMTGSVCGYYLVSRAARSFRDGFLSKPLNIILCLTLPLLLFAIIIASGQFPSMFIWEYITVPSSWFGFFVSSVLVAGICGIGALEQFESRGYYQRFRQTIVFKFIKENLPGIYAGGMFFFINLIIARALNHPALSINTVLFESDAGPWMSILGSPEGDVINRSVHPLVLITVRPLVRFAAIFMANQWNLAPMLVVAAMSGLCVLMAWIFVKRATQHASRTYALIFAIMLGSTAAHLFFGSITDTYVFGITSLIFFLLLIQAKENRFSVLVPAGLLLFGITITNIAQGVIGLFFNKFGFWRLVRYCMVIIAAGVALTVLTSALYPNRQTFFFVPGDIAFETNFVKPVYESPAERLLERFKIVSRAMLLYGVTAPRPLEVIADKPPRPTIDLKTFEPRTNTYASYKGLANIPLALWLTLLAGSFLFFVKGLRSSPHLPLMLGLLGSLAFNFLLHMNYGTELFLYTPFWTYALVFFVALALADFAGKKWFESLLIIFVVVLMINNFWFIFTILRGLAPFYAAT